MEKRGGKKGLKSFLKSDANVVEKGSVLIGPASRRKGKGNHDLGREGAISSSPLAGKRGRGVERRRKDMEGGKRKIIKGWKGTVIPKRDKTSTECGSDPKTQRPGFWWGGGADTARKGKDLVSRGGGGRPRL